MTKPIAAQVALTFLLAVALSPTPALAQASGANGAPPAPARAIHRHVRRAPGEARLARPSIGQPPLQNLPAISRNPEDCTKTMCTCLQGGGC
jgi:hypothetical protein